MATLAAVRTELAGLAAGFDAGPLTATEAEAVVREATAIVNLASGLKTLAAKRVADSGTWKHRGHRSAADWLASTTKSTVGDAIGALETAENLVDCPGVEAKVRSGELTGQQAHAISKAVAADPASESKLLDVAKADGISKLRERCRAVEHAAASAAEERARYDKIRRERFLRHWTDDDGAFRLAAKLTPEAGAKVLGALAPFEKAAFDQARHDGRHESPDAYRADALVHLADSSLAGTTTPDDQDDGDGDDDGDGGADAGRRLKAKHPKSRKPSFTVLVDLQALLRGHTQPGETCEIPGVGPVPVSRLYDYAPEAVWHALITDGVDIHSYCSLTRLFSQLERRWPGRSAAGDAGGTAERPSWRGAPRPPVAGPVKRRPGAQPRACHRHHRMKHQEGWILDGGPGHWTFTPPDQAAEPVPDGPDPP